MSAQVDVRRRWRYRMLRQITTRGLVRMGKLAHREGDLHELHHLHAQLLAGNSANCGSDCILRATLIQYFRFEASPTEEVAP